MSLLEVSDLHTHFVTRDRDDRIRTARALNGVGFTLQKGRILGLVGESGAGKSLTVTSILGLLHPPARVVAGRALFQGRDLLAMSASERSALRGNRIGFVVQSAKASLDPLARVGEQLVRVQRAHARRSRREAMERAEAILAAVSIPDPKRRLAAWPHEFSGGMAQRVVIALALVNEPDLLIADEPTTALDVTVQAQILDLLSAAVRGRGIGAIIVTHDLGVVAQYCDDVAVMFAGSVVEQGPVAEVFPRPMHPYTQALLAATPERLRLGAGLRLGGPPPNLYALPEGCCYRLRCDRSRDVCRSAPPLAQVGDQRAACHFAREPAEAEA
ncbi:MAG: ABC transporter ATP-binding protein [Rhodospirillales bacterium]|nr:ABC transporter ATP-binding protein [Rhodospirillales bacterium]